MVVYYSLNLTHIMDSYKEILGVLTLIIALVSYSTYFFNIFTTCALPRTTSWLIWGILSTIAFFVQYGEGAGSGAWVTGFTALMCLLISLISYIKCEEHLTNYDWLPLIASLFAIFFWWYTSDALIAILLTSLAYGLGFVPTLHNAYLHPEEEVATTFALNALKFFIALFALEYYSLVTTLYPLVLVSLNTLLVIVIIIQRKRRHV